VGGGGEVFMYSTNQNGSIYQCVHGGTRSTMYLDIKSLAISSAAFMIVLLRNGFLSSRSLGSYN
jgi:hypothetical protein